jgi:CBS domain containing-hemolysin-like protein
VARLGHLATPGDLVDLGTWEAEVEDVRSRSVQRVRFRKKRESSPAAAPIPAPG